MTSSCFFCAHRGLQTDLYDVLYLFLYGPQGAIHTEDKRTDKAEETSRLARP